MRETLYQMQENAGQGPFPLTIGHVTKAITFNSPHSGKRILVICQHIHAGGVHKVMTFLLPVT